MNERVYLYRQRPPSLRKTSVYRIDVQENKPNTIVHAIAYLFWALALNSSQDSSLIASLAYLTPFFSIIISSISLGEKISASSLLALVVIIGGVLITQIPAICQELRKKPVTHK